MEDTSTLLFYSTQVFSIIFFKKGDTIVLGFWVLLEAWDTFGQDLIEIILLNLQDVLPELSGDDVRAKEQERNLSSLMPDLGDFVQLKFC